MSTTPQSPRHERWIAPLVAAVVVLGVLGGVRGNRGPKWLEAASGAPRFEPGASVHPSAEEAMICAGYAKLVAAPGAEFTAPTSPGRWIGRGIGTHLTRGELRLMTEERFVGRILAINAPQADVVATEGIFLVRAEGESTIVSVLTGTAHLLVAHGAPVDVGAGERAATGGGAAKKSALGPDDRAALERLRAL
ncbi:MAG: hypothetical protein U0527_11520 [Candidatus Eisenbacteria bacterium]